MRSSAIALTLVACLMAAGCAAAPPAMTPPATELATPVPPTPELETPVPPTPEPATPEPPPTSASGLQDALAFVDRDTTQFSFTDWSTIWRSVGAEDLRGGSPAEAKTDALRSLTVAEGPREAAFLSLILQRQMTMYEDWGFDLFDLEWEASARPPDGQPLRIVRFRDPEVVDRIAAQLGEYGFDRSHHGGGTLHRTQLADLAAHQLGSYAGMATFGLPPDGRTIYLGGLGEPAAAMISELLESGPPADPPAPLQAATDLLDAPTSLIIENDFDCDTVATTVGASPAVTDAIDALFDRAGPLHPYLALGVGYRRAHEPIGRIVFVYATPQQAAADLEGRRLLAEEGISLTSQEAPVTYAERVFTLVDATLVGDAVVLDVVPVDDSPARLEQMLLRRDMLFAACTTP
jgi:hypothetical protein